MLKETETEETRRFCHLFLIGDVPIGGSPGPLGSLATPMMHKSWLLDLCFLLWHASLLYNENLPVFFTLHTISCFILSRVVEAKAVEAIKFFVEAEAL